jgi:zinc protease
MAEKCKFPMSRMTLAAWVGCASAAALGAVFPAAPTAAAAAEGTSPSAATASAATPAAVAGFSYVKSVSRIDEYRLDSNGLTVLLVPDHSAPVVTFQVTYQVGSRNEVTGATGATHILEHLMFKGSESFNDPKGNSVKQFLERVGGQFNASTSFDRTNYFATIGRESLEGYIAIEADRMRHLWLHEADRQSEMTVVRNEY